MTSGVVATVAGFVLVTVIIVHSTALVLWILTAVKRDNYGKAAFFFIGWLLFLAYTGAVGYKGVFAVIL